MQKHLLGLLLLAPALAQAQAPYTYTVKGQLGTLNAPAKVYLVQGTEPLDSATLHNGAFELHGSTEWPHSAELVLERNGKLRDGFVNRMQVKSPDRLDLFLEPGPVVVTSADSLPKAHVAGGPLNADYQRMRAAVRAVESKMNAKDGEHTQARFDAIMQECAQAEFAFIKANPQSWVSLEALGWSRMMGAPTYAEVAPLYEAFSPAMKASPPGRQYGEMLQGLKVTAIGAQAPNFTQQTPDGKTVSLADYRGRYVLVDFWASWCTPCRAENPYVLQAYTTYKNRRFTVLSVSLDETEHRAKWLKAIAEDHLPWTQVADLGGFEGEIAKRYGIQSIPQNFLIDPSGKIVAANLRGEELVAKLGQYLK